MPRVTIYARDYVMIICLLLMIGIVIGNWSDYHECRDPIPLWLVVDYLAFIFFRVIQFGFQYSVYTRTRNRCTRLIPRSLAIINLWVVYPFLWLWSIIGCVWFSRSSSCIPQDNGGWGFISWLLFSFLYLTAFGGLIYQTYRINRLQGSAQYMRALLATFQRANAYGIQPEPDTQGLAEDEIRELISRPIRDDEKDTTCAICLADLQTGDVVRDIPCRHLFHTRCLDQWLQVKATCPGCRQHVAHTVESPLLPM